MAIIVNPGTGSQYVIQELLGSGSFGKVFKAYNSSMRKIVAVKMIHCYSLDQATEAVKEATLHGTIQHVNILKCYAVFSIPDYMGSVMTCLIEEFCDGGSLADQIRTRRYNKYRETKSWVLQILSGLIKIHQHTSGQDIIERQ
ncbi:unnamed protein product [Rotaria sp. Silwood1]|nr:unnamed protein product [Rotaria sp. Silwood1]